MSMFYELMMRKKEEIMYATIKGTLTENDGVFSGFSQSNYLITQSAFPLQPAKFEIFVKIKNTATDNNERYFVAGQYRTSFIIGITKVSANTFTFKLYGGNADGTGAGWNKTSEQITIDETQFFGVKFSYDGSEYALYVNGIKIISYLSTTRLYGNAPIYFGKWSSGGNTNIFVGEIDLNNSYIKLGSTKYNLQAVVGYTVVGSPTITDGVVSGFSSANYLKINVPSDIYYNTFELGVKFKTTDNSISQRLFINAGNLYITIGSGILSLNYYNTSNNWSSRNSGSLSNNNWYWYKIKFDIINKFLIAERSTDGINYTQVLNSQDISNINENIRIKASGIAFCDQDNNQYTELGISDTYIKVNNKLWFNGQQA